MPTPPLPLVSPLPVTPQSGPFNPASPDVLAEVGYLEDEYLITGLSTIYRYDADWRVEVAREHVPYTTQLIVRRPADPARFSGNVVFETMHKGYPQGSMFGLAWDVYCARGDAWAQIVPWDFSVPLAVDPDRYGPLNQIDFGQVWDMIAQAGLLLRSGAESSPLRGYDVRRVFATGLSGTGMILLTYLGDGFHDRYRRADGGPIFDGYLPYIAHGVIQYQRIASPPHGVLPYGFLGRNEGMPHPFEQIPLDDPRRTVPALDVPVMHVLTEAEVILPVEPPPVRDLAPNMFEYGLPATTEARLRYRRPDDERFRLYEIPGAGHVSRPDPIADRVVVQTLTPQQALRLGTSRGEAIGQRLGKPVSDFPTRYLVSAMWENLFRWVEDGTAPPAGATIEVGAGPLRIVRDEHGNARGGVRSPWLDVPTATYTGVNPGFALLGAKEPFDAATLQRLYGDTETYLSRFAVATDEAVAGRRLLPQHAQRIKDDAAATARF